MEKNVTNLLINSSHFMRLISLTIMLALITPVMTHAQAGKANFAGTWAVNAAKSTQPAGGGGGGGGQRGGGGNMVVKQEANLLSIDRTRTGQDGTATTTTTKYTLDGKESINTSAGRNGTSNSSKSTAKWSADGKSLTVVTKSTFNDTERTSSEVYTLTDAKTISILSTRQGQDGEVKTTRVYDKK